MTFSAYRPHKIIKFVTKQPTYIIYGQNTTIQIYEYVKTFTCIGIRKTLETLTTFGSSGTKLLLPSWLLGFQHEERETQFLLCWLFHLTPPRAALHRKQLDLSWFKSQLTGFFSKYPRIPPHRFRAWRHSHPQSHLLSGGFIITSVIVTSSLREREHLHSMCAPN